ncbi:MAG: ATP-binding protein, partial [Planctomycetota bacterium]
RVDVARDDGAVVVEIADTGPGIPADQREAVFEEYVRLEGSGAEGTGLGLPLARRLAELLEGSLDLASTPGTGTCVRLRIPACRS